MQRLNIFRVVLCLPSVVLLITYLPSVRVSAKLFNVNITAKCTAVLTWLLTVLVYAQVYWVLTVVEYAQLDSVVFDMLVMDGMNVNVRFRAYWFGNIASAMGSTSLMQPLATSTPLHTYPCVDMWTGWAIVRSDTMRTVLLIDGILLGPLQRRSQAGSSWPSQGAVWQGLWMKTNVMLFFFQKKLFPVVMLRFKIHKKEGCGFLSRVVVCILSYPTQSLW